MRATLSEQPVIAAEAPAVVAEQLSPYAGVSVIGPAGRASRELPAGPPGNDTAADHELSACSVPGLEVRAASIRGLMHRYREEPRQDRFSLVSHDATGGLVVTVCDGVGSLKRSQDAAALVAAKVPHEFIASGNWAKAVSVVNDELARLAADTAAAAPNGADPVDYGMSTTFVGVALARTAEQAVTASIAWTDDSSVWLLRDGRWTNLTPPPAIHEDADPALHSTRVRALPHRDPRVQVVEVTIDRGALFVMTDGVGVPLELASDVRRTLAEWWVAPPDVFTFGRQVGFARKGHQDDRTVVGIWLSPGDGR